MELNDFLEGSSDFLKSIKGPAIRIFLAFIIFTSLTAIFSVQLINFFKMLVPSGVELIAFSPAEVFMTVIGVILFFGVILTFPIFLFELIKFVMPALFEKEKKILKAFLPISLILFFLGAIFGVYIMAFFGLIFFADFASTYGISNLWSLGGLIQNILMIAFGFGIAFELPILIVALNKFGIVTIEQLKSFRKIIIVIILFVSALLTPPDVLSQILMGLPLYFLYEGTIIYLKIFNKNKKEV
jgi:sec-independent protein translocase protein TatC